jgi:hypothetical protein
MGGNEGVKKWEREMSRFGKERLYGKKEYVGESRESMKTCTMERCERHQSARERIGARDTANFARRKTILGGR